MLSLNVFAVGINEVIYLENKQQDIVGGMAASYHRRFIFVSTYFIALAIGLIGTKYSLPFFVFVIPILRYIEDIYIYFKHGEIKDRSLKALLKKPSALLLFVKNIFIIGVITGGIANVLIYYDLEYYAINIVSLSIIYVVIVKIGVKLLKT
jgi:hypothetical protein